MLIPVNARRRWFGAFFLVLAGGMLIWGETLLEPWLKGPVFVLYWIVCFLLTGLAMFIALLDARAIRRQVKNQQREEFHKAFEDMPEPPQSPKDRNPKNTRPPT